MSSTSQKTFTFTLPEELKDGLRTIRDRDGIAEAEQIRRGIRMWLDWRAHTAHEENRYTPSTGSLVKALQREKTKRAAADATVVRKSARKRVAARKRS